MRNGKIPLPAALGLAALFTAGRWWAGRQGFVPDLWMLLLIAPAVEETLYRGILFPAFREVLPLHAAAGLSAVFFALGHGSLPAMVCGLGFGYGVALLKEKKKRLLWPVLLHAAWNLAVYLAGWIPYQAIL